MTALRLVIAGRVQGVGFRDWLAGEAFRAGLDGWVRNRRDGSIEAVLSGPAQAVEDLARRCEQGPPAAAVSTVQRFAAEPPAEPGFFRYPTA